MRLRSFYVLPNPLGWLAVCGILLLVPATHATPSWGQGSHDSSSSQQTVRENENALKDLVATLEDETKRTAFLQTLKAALAAQDGKTQSKKKEVTAGSALVDAVSTTLGRIATQVGTLSSQVTLLRHGLHDLQQRLQNDGTRRALLVDIVKAIAALALGAAARLTTRRLLSPLRHRLMASLIATPRWKRWPLMGGHFLVEIIPPAIMAATAWAAVPFLHASDLVGLSIIGIVGAIALLRGVLSAANTVLYPADHRLRMINVDNETAHYLMVWIRRLASIAILAYGAISVADLLGASAAVLFNILALLVTALLIVFVVRNRRPVATALRKGTENPPPDRLASQYVRHWLAGVWHILASLYIMAVFIIGVGDSQDGFPFMAQATAWSIVILGVGSLAMRGVHQCVGRAFAISEETARRFPGLNHRANRYGSALETVLRIFVTGLCLGALLSVWGVDVLPWIANAIGQRLASGLFTIVLVVVLTLVVWELSSAWIERYFSTTDADGTLLERSARAHTLLPLARNVLVIVLGVVVVLTILSEIGVNIAPLLAGAGVVGLAIGVGAQKLVQDVITGAFILVEDTISLGDIVKTGTHSGVVEGLSIRSLRLRDIAGSVHTIPFSSVDTVVNMTRDYSFYVLNVGVAYREDTDFVCDVLSEVAVELAEDPEFGGDIMEALEINGVDQLADNAVVIRARIKTKPIQQWRIGREFNRRMKKAFDHYGIEIPFPHQTIYFGEDRSGNAPPLRVRINPQTPEPPRRKDATPASHRKKSGWDGDDDTTSTD